jgi:pyrimidine-nucleoside phosphorylase
LTPYELIRLKRDGGELPADELRAFLDAYARGQVSDAQMAAFLMAVFLRGLAPSELAVFVEAIIESGAVLDLRGIPGPKVDKHSTGGVGDKVSLVLAPLVASLGVVVPMMSGRSLGHTGGTLDKLETIPGFRTDLTVAEMRAQLERIGCVLIGQTDEIAPLDRRLYALRDATATVESIPLIASSIMGKKLAEGVDALVLDVKVGSGGFLPEEARALELARTMVEIGRARGQRVTAILTAMDRPLGYAVGNALEMEEAILALQGGGPEDLREVVLTLAAEMLVLGGLAADVSRAKEEAAAALADGRALQRMAAIVEAQGGNPAVLEDPALLPQAPVRRVLEAGGSGWIHEVDAGRIGLAAVRLGAGRTALGGRIDPAVGFHITAKPGQAVEAGQPLATVHARSEADAEAGLRALREAIRIGEDAAPEPLPLIGRRIGAPAVAPAVSGVS